MKDFKLIKKTITPFARPIRWLGTLKKKRRNLKVNADFIAENSAADGMNLKIMSFNIRRGTAADGKNHWVYRRKLVIEVLTRYLPDIVGLQEALDFQMEEISAMLPGYAKIGAGNLGGREGMHNAIFYNEERFDLTEEKTFWFSDTPDIPGSKGWGNSIPRICTWVRLVEKRSGRAFYFYNAHLDHLSLKSRKKSVVYLIRQIRERQFREPFILVGDFNAREKSAPIQYLKGIHLLKTKPKRRVLNPDPLVDTFRVCYPDLRKVVSFHGYHRFIFRLKIDYIFVPPSVRVDDAEIIQLRWKRRYPSDHFPLFAEIHIPGNDA